MKYINDYEKELEILIVLPVTNVLQLDLKLCLATNQCQPKTKLS
jgi:hypothetical protein